MMREVRTKDYSENKHNSLNNHDFYSLPKVKENVIKVFSPQCLLNNPITDPKHSQYVHSYIQETLHKEKRMRERELSVRQALVSNKLGVIDLSNTEKIEEDKRYERYQLDHKHKIEHEYSEPPCKPPKLLRLERQYSGLVEKIHADCLMATVEDIHGNYPLHNAVIQNNLKLVIRYSLVLTAMNKTLDLINNQGMVRKYLK